MENDWTVKLLENCYTLYFAVNFYYKKGIKTSCIIILCNFFNERCDSLF